MNPYLLPALPMGPVIVTRLLEEIPHARLDEVVVEGRFTAREVIAHLVDWEPIMRERILLARDAPGATIAVLDESEMAVANGYAGSDTADQCALFQRERALTVEFAFSLQPGDWRKIVLHPERGPLSAEDLTNLLLGHDLYHIEQLSAYLCTTI